MPQEGVEPSTFRLRDGCSASTWTAPDGSSLLTLDASLVQTGPDGSRPIVWMINRMIKQGRHARRAEVAEEPTLGISPRCCRHGMIRAVRWARGAPVTAKGTGCRRGVGLGSGGC